MSHGSEPLRWPWMVKSTAGPLDLTIQREHKGLAHRCTQRHTDFAGNVCERT